MFDVKVECHSFNGDISNWNVSGVPKTSEIFDGRLSFNRPGYLGLFESKMMREGYSEEALEKQISQFFDDAVLTQLEKPIRQNDMAHRYEHLRSVYDCGMEINKRLGLKYSPYAIFTVAVCHDLFAWSRNNHEELSAIWILTTDNKFIASLVRIIQDDTGQTSGAIRHYLSDACRYHRASNLEDFPHEFAELMNAADRELPDDVGYTLKRAYLYGDDAILDEDVIGTHKLQRALEHIQGKYGVGGYARYPDLYQRAFGSELTAFRQQITDLDEDTACDLLNRVM